MRALGLGSSSILGAFLGKAILVGGLGGAVGVATGIGILHVRVMGMSDSLSMWATWNSASLTWTAIWIPILMVLLTVVASWLPQSFCRESERDAVVSRRTE